MPSIIPGRPKGRPATASPAFRLDLTIGGTTYAIRPVAQSPPVGSRAFRLVKGDGTIYDVASTAHGPICDCPDYIFRRDGLDPEGCKHIRAMIGSGLIDLEIGAVGGELPNKRVGY